MKSRQKKSTSDKNAIGAYSSAPAVALSPGKRWTFRLAALVLLPLFCLALIEVGLRFVGYGYPTGFFEKVRLHGRDYLINNEKFSSRFFSPQLARVPAPVLIEAKKPANTYRIFILGESAARGEPEPAYAASRYLQVLLEEKFSGERFEVVNLGITAINSHVILPIARDCVRADGDLWIIYMGNNEMVGPFGAATVFGAKSPPLKMVRWQLAAQQSRLVQWLVALARNMRSGDIKDSWGGMQMFVGNELRADDPRREMVYKNFERNLDDILLTARNSGAKILLNTVAVNLKDCPPFASLLDGRLSSEEQGRFRTFYDSAQLAVTQKNYSAAFAAFAAAEKLDPKFAELQFRWAECFLALTNVDGAREHFQKACDVDALSFRADSRINSIIRKEGARFSDARLASFDAAEFMNQSSPEKVAGHEDFFEHVHFNFAGNFLLGLAWAERVETMLPNAIRNLSRTKAWCDRQTCDRLRAVTDWDRHSVRQLMIERMQKPPLNKLANHVGEIQRLQNEEQQFRQRWDAAAQQEALHTYVAAIEKRVGEELMHEKFAGFLETAGDFKHSLAQWEAAKDLDPFHYLPWFQAGRLLSRQSNWDDARVSLNRALGLRPHSAEIWFELGGVELGAEKYKEAMQDYHQAQQIDRSNGLYVAFEGKALAKLDCHLEATRSYRRAIQITPGLWQAHLGLGDELSNAQDFAAAEKEYGEATRLLPTLTIAHMNRGVMLTRLNQYNEALHEFQTVLQLDPNNYAAREYLKRVTDWKE